MKTRLAGMLTVVGAAIALLAASSAVALEPTWLTEDSFGTPEIELASPQSPVDTDAIAEEISQFEANHEAKVSAPEAILERENSVDAFADLGPNAAASLLLDRFSEMLRTLTTLPSDPVIQADEILKVNSDSSVSIDPAGARESSLVVSDAPMRNADNEFLDNTLSSANGGFTPEAALVETKISGVSNEQIEFPESGVSIGLDVQSADSTEGQVLSSAPGENDLVFYPNTEEDTDTAVSATLSGVEIFSILRSEESPEALSFEYGMPDGAVLSSTEDGGAVITDGGEDPLAQIFPPYAVDAQGTFVPVALSVEGDSVVLNVDHQGVDFAYPILVDPVTHLRDWWTNGSGIDYAGWAFNESGTTNYVSSTSCPSAVLPGDPCGGTGAGLYTSAQPGSYYPAGSMGYWTFTAPGGASSSITGANLGSWRFRKGASTNGNPYAFYALGNSGTSMTTTTNTGGANYGLTGSSDNTKYLHVGLATNANVTLPSGSTNWRYNRLAGFSLSMTDGEAPTLSMSGVPTGWLKDNTDFTVTATAADPGLGLGWIQALYGGSWTNKWVGWCTGTYGAECPKTASPTMTFNTSGFSSGVNGIYTKAIDIVSGTGHETLSGFNFNVDKVAPTISTIAPLVEGSDSPATGDLHLTWASSDAHSGIKRVDFSLDGAVISSTGSACEGIEVCVSPESMDIDLSGFSAGSHSWTLKAVDGAGNSSTIKSGTMTLDPASGNPDDLGDAEVFDVSPDDVAILNMAETDDTFQYDEIPDAFEPDQDPNLLADAFPTAISLLRARIPTGYGGFGCGLDGPRHLDIRNSWAYSYSTSVCNGYHSRVQGVKIKTCIERKRDWILGGHDWPDARCNEVRFSQSQAASRQRTQFVQHHCGDDDYRASNKLTVQVSADKDRVAVYKSYTDHCD